jgi:general secretion pathway protein L
MARRILGIDLGATSVKCVLLESAYRGFTIVDAAAQPLPAPAEGAPATLRDRQATALRELVAARGWTYETAAVALPGAGAASHLVTLPFTDLRRIEQTIAFEVEAQIPFDLAEVAWDWQLLGVRNGKSEAFVGVVRREEVAGVLAALAGAGVDPRSVVPPAPAYAALLGQGVLEGEEPTPVGSVAVFLDVGQSRTSACIASGAGLEWARTIALGAADVARSPGALVRELRGTLKAFRARFAPEARPVHRLFLAGEATRVPGLAETLAAEVEGPVTPLALAGPAATIPGEEQPRFALALALAIRAHHGARGPRLNLRRRELAFTRDFEHVRGKVARLAAWAGLVVLLALVSAGVKTFALSRQEKLLDRALCDATQKIVGKCYDDFTVAESVLRGRGTPAGAIPKVSAVDVFTDLAQRAPQDVPLRFDRIEISRDKLHLQGTTDAAESVDRIVASLRGSRCFADARSGGARRRGGADAKFEFSIDSDLTCETTGAVAAGGRTP